MCAGSPTYATPSSMQLFSAIGVVGAGVGVNGVVAGEIVEGQFIGPEKTSILWYWLAMSRAVLHQHSLRSLAGVFMLEPTQPKKLGLGLKLDDSQKDLQLSASGCLSSWPEFTSLPV